MNVKAATEPLSALEKQDMKQEAKLAADLATYEHLDHVRRLLRVFANALLERGETHDRSKLGAVEGETFAEFTPKLKGCTYGSNEYKGYLAAMKPALDHHYACNRHHPEHFTDGINGMNLVDLLEMWIDWKASTLRHDDGDIMRSIEINQKRFAMSDQLRRIFENTEDDLKRGLCSNTSEPRLGGARVKKLGAE